MMERVALVCFALLVAGLSLPACSDDGDPDGNNVVRTNPDADPNNGTPDGGDAGRDADAAGGDADATGDDAADGDTGEEITDLCNGITDLGTIEASGGATASGDTAGGTNLVDPICGTEGNREVVYQFSVDGAARVNVEVQSQQTDDWVLGLYEGSCDDPQRIKCEDSRADVFVAEPGVTYFLAVEPLDPSVEASFSLSLATTALECAPMGATSCDGDRVNRCESGFTEVTYSCAYACQNTACGADICDNAIEVAGAGSETFTGSYVGYGSNFNFQNRDDCTGASVGVNTPGQDLVFFLPGLSAGQTVTIDASGDDFQEGIFVLEGACSQQATCAAGGLDVDGILDWTVETDGDYYVVIDLLEEQSGDFDITITR